MKNYMKSVIKNLVVLVNLGSDDVLKRNSYSLLNVSPRAF